MPPPCAAGFGGSGAHRSLDLARGWAAGSPAGLGGPVRVEARSAEEAWMALGGVLELGRLDALGDELPLAAVYDWVAGRFRDLEAPLREACERDEAPAVRLAAARAVAQHFGCGNLRCARTAGLSRADAKRSSRLSDARAAWCSSTAAPGASATTGSRGTGASAARSRPSVRTAQLRLHNSVGVNIKCKIQLEVNLFGHDCRLAIRSAIEQEKKCPREKIRRAAPRRRTMYAPLPLERFDLVDYFVRIELKPPASPAPPGPPPPTLATLAALQWAHLRAIPFENFSLRLPAAGGLPPRADPAAAFAKLVRARRGGWCFEHAPVLGAALAALGFAVWSGTARVAERAPAAAPPPGRLALSPIGAHHVLFVDVGGDIFLVDGGAAGLEAPLPLRVPAPGAAADASGADAYAGAAWAAALPGAPAERMARYRLRPALLGCAGGGAAPAAAAAAPGAAHAGGFCLQHRQADAAAGSGDADAWKDAYYFTLAPALPTDFAAMNELSLTRPRFTEHTIATRWTLGGRVALLDGSLRRHGADGALVGEETLEGEAALLAAARDEFGVAL